MLLGAAVRLVARLGGHIDRANHPPGHQIMWRGYVKLQSMCEGFALHSGKDFGSEFMG